MFGDKHVKLIKKYQQGIICKNYFDKFVWYIGNGVLTIEDRVDLNKAKQIIDNFVKQNQVIPLNDDIWMA